MTIWRRTCQECGHKQYDNDPTGMNATSFGRFQDRKCKKCKSEALDYGTEEITDKQKDENARLELEELEQ